MPILLFLSMEDVTRGCSRENANPPPSTTPEWKRQCVGFSQEGPKISASDRSVGRSTARHVMSSMQCMNRSSRSQIWDGGESERKEVELAIPKEVDDKAGTGNNKPHIMNQIKSPYPERSFGPLPGLYTARCTSLIQDLIQDWVLVTMSMISGALVRATQKAIDDPTPI